MLKPLRIHSILILLLIQEVQTISTYHRVKLSCSTHVCDNMKRIRTFIYPIIYFLLFIFYLVMIKGWIKHISSFGCFDDCHIFASAYFMTQGKTLYSQIFFNHQPLMVFISFLIQEFKHPQSVFEFLLYHRYFIYGFSAVMGMIIAIRFRIAGIMFVILYEITK